MVVAVVVAVVAVEVAEVDDAELGLGQFQKAPLLLS